MGSFLTIKTRKTYTKCLLQADERIGVGGAIRYPFNRALRELVFMRLVFTGDIYSPADKLPAVLAETIDATLASLEIAHE